MAVLWLMRRLARPARSACEVPTRVIVVGEQFATVNLYRPSTNGPRFRGTEPDVPGH
jgi:hypothetical protein